MPEGRTRSGTFAKGVSGNPGGASVESVRRRRQLAELALADSPHAIKRIREMMDDEDGKVAIAACTANLKVAGVMGEAVERQVEVRLRDLLAQAEKAIQENGSTTLQ